MLLWAISGPNSYSVSGVGFRQIWLMVAQRMVSVVHLKNMIHNDLQCSDKVDLISLNPSANPIAFFYISL